MFCEKIWVKQKFKCHTYLVIPTISSLNFLPYCAASFALLIHDCVYSAVLFINSCNCKHADINPRNQNEYKTGNYSVSSSNEHAMDGISIHRSQGLVVGITITRWHLIWQKIPTWPILSILNLIINILTSEITLIHYNNYFLENSLSPIP